MIYSLKGTLIYTEPTYAVVSCNGVGFKCYISLNTLKDLPSVGNEVELYTHLSVREDSLDLYGFISNAELELFRLLITVSGVGPKAATAILSVMPVDRLTLAISSGDIRSIQQANGVGKKTAERVILELKDKMAGIGSSAVSSVVEGIQSFADNNNALEAVEVLVSLGFDRSDASAVIGTVDKSLSADEMVRIGLKQLSSQL